MIKLEFPRESFRIRKEGARHSIFDGVRRQWVALTPEEWVRQNLLHYLMQILHYPASMIAAEKEIPFGGMLYRFDLLVYDLHHRPWLMVECKAMEVPLTPPVLEQIIKYNMALPVKYLFITNGLYCRGFERGAEGLLELNAFPVYETGETESSGNL